MKIQWHTSNYLKLVINSSNKMKISSWSGKTKKSLHLVTCSQMFQHGWESRTKATEIRHSIQLEKIFSYGEKKTKGNHGNYRPVSFQHFTAKIVEQVLLASISGHMRKVYGNIQRGFIGKSMPDLLDCFPQWKATSVNGWGQSALTFPRLHLSQHSNVQVGMLCSKSIKADWIIRLKKCSDWCFLHHLRDSCKHSSSGLCPRPPLL